MKVINSLSKFRNLTLEEIRFLTACTFVFSLPFDRMYSQLLLIILIVLVLIDFSVKKIRLIPKSFWIFQITFLLSVTGLLYTSSVSMKDGTFMVEKQLAIFIFPLLLPLSFTVSKERIRLILKTLTISCVVSILYLIISGVLIFLNLGITFQEFVGTNMYFNHSFSSPLGIHAGYLSMFISLSFFFLLSEIGRTKRKKTFFLVTQIIILIIGLILLASRANTVIILLISLLLYPLFYVEKIKKFVIPIIIITGITFTVFNFSPYLNKRFTQELMGDISMVETDVVEPRILRWKVCTSIIFESPVIGHGTGEEVRKLQEKYWEKGMIYSYYHQYNAHNQYLSILIKHGIIGLVVFIGALIFYFKLAIRNRSFIYLSFLLQMTILFLTENVLDANKGIFFFAFFNTLLGFYYLKNNSENDTISISNNSLI